MAGKVKKGFGIYMFMLLLSLIAAFLIVVMVMIFSPFRVVLGYQYVFYHDEVTQYNVTGGGTGSMFDLSALDEIKINCNYADVEVRRTDDVENNAIVIENFAKGFAKEDDRVDFSYQIYYENGSDNKILCVDVDEAECFLYFSKYVKISILLPENDSVDLSGVKLNVTNDVGNIRVAYGNADASPIEFRALDLKTHSGSIHLGNLLGKFVDDVFLSTKSGNVEVAGDLFVANSFALNSTSGILKFQNVVLGAQNANMILGNSQFSANEVVGKINIQIDDGYFDVAKLTGDISGNNAAEQMTTSTINIAEVVGNVSFPFANEARININKISDGKIFVRGTTGSVNVGDLAGSGWIEMTSGNVNIGLSGECEIKTTSGAINVVYKLASIENGLNFSSESGAIKLGVNSSLEFLLSVYNTAGLLRGTGNISIEGIGAGWTLPFEMNNGSKPVNITTDGKVDIVINK